MGMSGCFASFRPESLSISTTGVDLHHQRSELDQEELQNSVASYSPTVQMEKLRHSNSMFYQQNLQQDQDLCSPILPFEKVLLFSRNGEKELDIVSESSCDPFSR